jgi:hypothetical protein
MNESGVQTDGRSHGDIETMTEELYREMKGRVSQAAVARTLYALFANYKDAPVQLFVPIIVRRQAKDLLRKQAAETSAKITIRHPG